LPKEFSNINMINMIANNDLLKYEQVFKTGYIACLNYLSLLKVTKDAEDAWQEEEKRKIK
jgi:hypothetical protein